MAQPTAWTPIFSLPSIGGVKGAATTVLSDGRILATWQDVVVIHSPHGNSNTYPSIHAQILNADGTAAAPAFKVNGLAMGNVGKPQVALLANGDFVIVYEQANAAAGIHNLIWHRYHADGTSLGETAVARGTGSLAPSVTALGTGGFAITHNNAIQNSVDGIGHIIVSNEGSILQDRIEYRGDDEDYRGPTAVALPNTGGKYVTVLSGFHLDDGPSFGFDIRSSTGVLQRSFTKISDVTEQVSDNVAITTLDTQEFVVTWKMGPEIKARLFGFDGLAHGAEFVVGAAPGAVKPNIVALPNGHFAIVFHPGGQNIQVKIFNNSGIPTEGFSVPGTQSDSYSDPVLTILADGRFLIEWNTQYAVRAQIFDPRQQGSDWTAGDEGQQYGGTLHGDHLRGGAGNDVFFGVGGADILAGNGGSDVLKGDAGDDLLEGGAGPDTLDGGAGWDVAIYARAASTNGSGVTVSLLNPQWNAGEAAGDTFIGIEAVQGSAHKDILVGDNAGNVLAGGAGDDNLDGAGGADRLDGGAGWDVVTYLHNTPNGQGVTVYLDTNSLNSGAAAGDVLIDIEVVQGTNSADALTGANDFGSELLGEDGSDTLAGGESSDRLFGGAGADFLHGRGGVDHLEGGGGGDTYHIDAGDQVIEGADGGDDTIFTSADYTLGDNVEKLHAAVGTASIALTGNGLANILFGNDGANVLDGRGGADVLIGGRGDDTYVFEDGDILDEAADSGNDTVQVGRTTTLSTFVNFENLTLTGTGDFNATGTAGGNVIRGNSGNNILDGGGGADTLVGGAGNDTYVIDGQDDQVDERAGEGSDTIVTHISYTLMAGSEVERLQAATGSVAIHLTGSSFANTLIGNDAGNILNGGAGADTLEGGGGNDTYILDNAGDRIVETAVGGTDTAVVSLNFSLAGVANVEVLKLADGTTAQEARGGAGNDRLVGNTAFNILDGGAGADTMEGGVGSDVFVVDQAGDMVIEALGGGQDAVQTTISYSLASDAEIEFLTALGSNAIDLTGNAIANTLSGNTAANVLDGGAGADRLEGAGGNDTYFVDQAGDVVVEGAGGGFDTVLTQASYTLAADAEVEVLTAMQGTAAFLTGNAFANAITGHAGADQLKGLAGDDVLTGGSGNDRLSGGLGRDVLTGDTGKDVFVFDTAVAKKKNANIDTIKSFSVKDDGIWLDNAIFTALGRKGSLTKPAKLKKDAFYQGSKAHDGDDRIVYNKKTGALSYDADGNGSKAAIKIATLSKNLKLTEKDFFVI
jgi:Ca2+-binding RTX toxin-like protein